MVFDSSFSHGKYSPHRLNFIPSLLMHLSHFKEHDYVKVQSFKRAFIQVLVSFYPLYSIVFFLRISCPDILYPLIPMNIMKLAEISDGIIRQNQIDEYLWWIYKV